MRLRGGALAECLLERIDGIRVAGLDNLTALCNALEYCKEEKGGLSLLSSSRVCSGWQIEMSLAAILEGIGQRAHKRPRSKTSQPEHGLYRDVG